MNKILPILVILLLTVSMWGIVIATKTTNNEYKDIEHIGQTNNLVYNYTVDLGDCIIDGNGICDQSDVGIIVNVKDQKLEYKGGNYIVYLPNDLSNHYYNIKIDYGIYCQGSKDRGGVSLTVNGDKVSSGEIILKKQDLLSVPSGRVWHGNVFEYEILAWYDCDGIDENNNEKSVYLDGYIEFIFDSNPHIIFDPSHLNFGKVPLGQTATRTIKLSNIGGHTWTGTIRLEGFDCFGIVSGEDSYTVYGTRYVNITISFTPPGITSYSATLIAEGDGLCNDATAFINTNKMAQKNSRMSILFRQLLGLFRERLQKENKLNDPPYEPKLSCPALDGKDGYMCVPYTFSAATIDPDTDPIKYEFMWGDGTFNTQTDFYPSGKTVKVTHIFIDSSNPLFCVKARAYDDKGNPSIWSPCFNIRILRNNAPMEPTLDGPTEIYAGISYSFTAYSTDSDGEQIRYFFDWGDGNTNITQFVNSGVSVTEKHRWSTGYPNPITIKVVAFDEHGAPSPEKIYTKIKNKLVYMNPIFQKFLDLLQDRFPVFIPLLS